MNNPKKTEIICNCKDASRVVCIGNRRDYEEFFSNLCPRKNCRESFCTLLRRIADDIDIDDYRIKSASEFFR